MESSEEIYLVIKRILGWSVKNRYIIMNRV